MTLQRPPTPDRRRYWQTLALSIALVALAGVLLWASPFGNAFERQFGVKLAYLIRGERTPPDEAIYIPLDQHSADRLCRHPDANLAGASRDACSINDLAKWARPSLAKLINRLSESGAAVIALDVNFFEHGNAVEDDQLARAIENAGNVVLLSDLEQRDEDHSGGIVVSIDRLHEPAPSFAHAAAATAPMALRRQARRDSFFTFVDLAGRHLPTMPVVALYMREQLIDGARWSECVPLQRVAANLAPHLAIERLRAMDRDKLTMWRDDTRCTAFMASATARLLFAGPERLFNLYQGVGAFRGPSVHELLHGDWTVPVPGMRDRVVFVGVDDRANRNPVDGHETAMGDESFSGVELAATAFANLLHDHDIKTATPLGGAMALTVFASLIGLPFLLSLRVALLFAAAAAVGFGFYTAYRFDRDDLLLPLAIPLFVLLPATIALGWRWQLGKLERLVAALEQFVPQRVKLFIHRFLRIPQAETCFGVCMHTDVAGYTTLCEALASEPMQLRALETEYWALIDAEIMRERGQRFAIAGDGMLCVWATEAPDRDAATRACRAALAIQRAVDGFNRRHSDTPFNTRIGMHAGSITIGPVGGGDRYTLTVGGDIPNTAARIESDVNKQLGTRLLVSEAVAELAAEIPVRLVGEFDIRGKTSRVVVYALLDAENSR
ncbi:MAG: CHASE2 domain-containing protein [Zoogloeaceae bacterium]|nr:CHASE2 domain-containing protein [Zoogloeaceae bacterium]